MSEEEKNKGGRPRFFDDPKNVSKLENVMKILPTRQEAASVIGCSLKTLERYCQFRYPEGGYDALKKEFGDETLVSLRRAMLKNALSKGNTTMQIFLAKNLLGMNDGATVNIPDAKITLNYKDD